MIPAIYFFYSYFFYIWIVFYRLYALGFMAVLVVFLKVELPVIAAFKNYFLINIFFKTVTTN